MPAPSLQRSDESGFFLNWPARLAEVMLLHSKTVRVTEVNCPDFQKVGPVIVALWHGSDLALLPHYGQKSRGVILISPSRDGNILSRAVTRMGYGTCRGSSSNQAASGLIAMKRSLQEGRLVIFAADGPRGPRGVAKPGAVYLAAKTGCPIYPLGAAASLSLIFKKSWNRPFLPLPGSRLIVYWGEPIQMPPEAAQWPARVQSRLLTSAITWAQRRAELVLAGRPAPLEDNQDLKCGGAAISNP